MKRGKFKDCVYRRSFYVFAGCDVEIVHKAFHRIVGGELIDDNRSLDAFVLCNAAHPEDIFIWFRNSKPGVGVISHECFHAAERVFNHIDANVSGEPFAYYLEWVVRSVANIVW